VNLWQLDIIHNLTAAVRRTEQVFRYHYLPFVRPRPLILFPYRTALADLCQRLDKDVAGLAGLEELQAALQGLCASTVPDQELRESEQSMQRFVEWLATAFRAETGSRCQ
jgi:hypothetical protein